MRDALAALAVILIAEGIWVSGWMTAAGNAEASLRGAYCALCLLGMGPLALLVFLCLALLWSRRAKE